MSETVAVPQWLLVILGVLAAGWIAERLLVPGIRWAIRRRVNRVLDEIGTRLSIEIPQFKLTRRQVLIDRLFHDERVQAAVEHECRARGVTRADALRRVDRYAREIVPSFNAYLYFRLGYWLARRVAVSIYRVRLGYVDGEALKRVDPRSTVVFVMNHRSNMDYVLVAFLAAEHVAISYAVGEWARVWPLQQLVRSMGAFFVRRNSGDPLYRMVLQRYVQMATAAGVPQAVFPEGGLTVDGRLREPRLGLLDYMVKSFDPAGERDLVFIPVGINYDRVLEDRSLLLKLDEQRAKPGMARALGTTARFILRNAGQVLARRWHRFGYACVNFGPPRSMREYLRDANVDLRTLSEHDRHRSVAALARTVMDDIAAVVPVLPVSLVATVFVRAGDVSLSELEIKSAAHELVRLLEASGARIYVPRGDQDYAIGVGLRMLVLRRVVTHEEGLYTSRPEDVKLLNYYANAVAHLVVAASLKAGAPPPYQG